MAEPMPRRTKGKLPDDWERLRQAADGLGIRLEMQEGLGVWEAAPRMRHQLYIDRVRRGIGRTGGAGDCGCHHVADVDIRFPDGSIKRPDISIWCSLPADWDALVEDAPEAVIEILSPGFHSKDLSLGAPFYASMGVMDVVVIDPRTGSGRHIQGQMSRAIQAPAGIDLACGCRLELPPI